jgi:hypothetical protein
MKDSFMPKNIYSEDQRFALSAHSWVIENDKLTNSRIPLLSF